MSYLTLHSRRILHGMDHLDNTKQFFDMQFTTGANKIRAAGHPHVHDAKLLDHGAAILIAGHGGMPNVNAVWVECNPQRTWLDKNDERKLMNMAYEHMNKNQEWMERFGSVSSDAANQPFAIDNTEAAKHFVKIMKTYHSKFVSNTVVCLSPSTEAAMQEIAMSLMEDVPEIVSSMERNPDLIKRVVGVDDDEEGIHERDICKELCIMLRRIQMTRAQFCKVVGRVLGYRHALQQGTAITARRLYQLEVEMRRGILHWESWLQLNSTKVASEVIKYGMYLNRFNFDWVGNALQLLYMDQSELDEFDNSKTEHEPDTENGPKRKRAVQERSIYEIPIQDRS